jgi:S-adenosylmethionine:tRNA ribosyltransferase-isomerase
LLRAGDLLVLNDTKVIPARLFGTRGKGRVEVFLHKKTGLGEWLAFARPFKRLHEGDKIAFANDFGAEIKKKLQDGEVVVKFDCDDATSIRLLNTYGSVPLPPYIKRPKGPLEDDRANYQTVYAQKEGAVAAPTAGLHFTPELLTQLDERGIDRVTLTLHVGAGTFLPVKADYVRDHVMHAEWGKITNKVAATINEARQQGRRIVAVGTTSLRLLESAVDDEGIVHPFSGETSIFIHPGYRFRAVDALMTNFHLPKSTLFMLVSAFAGLERMKSAYEHAITNNYRFYSYGDATLLEKSL